MKKTVLILVLLLLAQIVYAQRSNGEDAPKSWYGGGLSYSHLGFSAQSQEGATTIETIPASINPTYHGFAGNFVIFARSKKWEKLGFYGQLGLGGMFPFTGTLPANTNKEHASAMYIDVIAGLGFQYPCSDLRFVAAIGADVFIAIPFTSDIFDGTGVGLAGVVQVHLDITDTLAVYIAMNVAGGVSVHPLLLYSVVGYYRMSGGIGVSQTF